MSPNLDSKTGQLNDAFVGDDVDSKTNKSSDDTNSSLSVDENKKKKKDKKTKEKDAKPELPPVSFFSLFRFASITDWFLVVLAMLASALTGNIQIQSISKNINNL